VDSAPESFGFETTWRADLFAPRIRGLISDGYHCIGSPIGYPAPSSPWRDVADRVRLGGTRPDATIDAAEHSGLRKFLRSYRSLTTDAADVWTMLPPTRPKVDRVARQYR